jgi:hypothetical protein
VIRGGADSLTGLGVITREISPDNPHHASLLIEGVERDGRFCPYLRGEVSNDLEKDWHKVNVVRPTGKAAKRTVDSQTLGEAIFVDLDAFRSSLGRKRYGRLVLPDGEAATFFLENLKPPEHVVETWAKGGMGEDELNPSSYEAPFLIPLKEQQPKTFGLLRVKNDATGIVGQFNYGALGGRSRTIEEQVNDNEEPVWPQAALEVANDYHGQWRKVGNTSNPDNPTELKDPPALAMWLNINLGAFRPMIGQFRYGQVILTTGDSTIIELVDLLPPEKELIVKEHPDWQQ